MATLFWKPLPVFTLTVRQFAGGKAVRVVAALAFIPAVFALIYLINTDVDSQRHFLIETIFRGIVAPTLLPITVLILATGALGNEIEDRTLAYLTLKPLSRFRIVFEKLLGILVVAEPTILAGLAVTYFLVMRSVSGANLRLLWTMLGSTAVAIIAYAAIFLLVSLVISRALLVGIIYSFVWESILGRFLPGLRLVSIRHFVESIFVHLLNDPKVTLDKASGLVAALITLLAAAVIAILLATWRLRSMNLE